MAYIYLSREFQFKLCLSICLRLCVGYLFILFVLKLIINIIVRNYKTNITIIQEIPIILNQVVLN